MLIKGSLFRLKRGICVFRTGEFNLNKYPINEISK